MPRQRPHKTDILCSFFTSLYFPVSFTPKHPHPVRCISCRVRVFSAHKRGPAGSSVLSVPQTLRLYSADTGYQTASLGNLFGLPYVVMRKPEPIDTTTLNYNWQVWNTNAFSVYTKETDAIDEQSAQEAVAAVLRYLSRVGLLRYNCHSGYLSSVVQENEMANVLTPAGGIFRRFVEPGQEVEYGQKLGVILDPFTAEVQAEITCPTSGVVFFALKKPLATEHEVAFKVIRRLHGGCL